RIVFGSGDNGAVKVNDTGAFSVGVVVEYDTVAGQQLERGRWVEDLVATGNGVVGEIDDPDLAAGVVGDEQPVAGLDGGTELSVTRVQRYGVVAGADLQLADGQYPARSHHVQPLVV